MIRLQTRNFRLIGLLVILGILSACDTNESQGIFELPTRYPTLTAIPSSNSTNVHVPMVESSTPTITASPIPLISYTPQPIDTLAKDATVAQTTYLYNAPHQQWLGQVEGGMVLLLTGRSNDGLWYEVETEDGKEGWLPSEFVRIADGAKIIPITYEIIYTPTPVPIPSSTPSDPVLRHVQAIYHRGQTTDNRPNVFSKVGDSLTDGQAFLKGYDYGLYNLGSYGYLQETINFFYGSFSRDGIADFSANGVDVVFDPMQTLDANCQPNEGPLECEYRLFRPSVSIIMLGSSDLSRDYSQAEFGQKLQRVIDVTLSYNIIPILTTFPNSPNYFPGGSEKYNAEIYRLANEYAIPLIDLRTAIVDFESYGVRYDGFHLSGRNDDDWYIDLTGEQDKYGLTMRNLMTLEMLHTLRRDIPMN